MVLVKLLSKPLHDDDWSMNNGLVSIVVLLIHVWFFSPISYAASSPIVEGVRFLSQTSSTRVVIETDGSLKYAVGRLPKPERLYVDLIQARLASGWQDKKLSVNDTQISAIRIAQYRKSMVRVVVDLKQIKTYKVFSLQKPHRIVIDLQGTAPSKPPPSQVRSPQPKPPSRAELQPTIVIDPGHGGKDPGALGPQGLSEKTVVLQVAKALRQLIQKHLPRYRVVLTRETDIFVPLTERTKIANDHQAEVFISIHTNASERRGVRGVETWYFSFEAKTERAQHIAARENNMSPHQFTELERILRDLHETDRINQSALLAGTTQKAMIDSLSKHDRSIPDRGVDGAPFIVLLHTDMPSILVEIGFLTNKAEAIRLQRTSYQQTLAQGIFEGLNMFLSKSAMKID